MCLQESAPQQFPGEAKLAPDKGHKQKLRAAVTVEREGVCLTHDEPLFLVHVE